MRIISEIQRNYEQKTSTAITSELIVMVLVVEEKAGGEVAHLGRVP